MSRANELVDPNYERFLGTKWKFSFIDIGDGAVGYEYSDGYNNYSITWDYLDQEKIFMDTFKFEELYAMFSDKWHDFCRTEGSDEERVIDRYTFNPEENE